MQRDEIIRSITVTLFGMWVYLWELGSDIGLKIMATGAKNILLLIENSKMLLFPG